jgi:uncharacterized protein YxjI
MDAPAAGWTRFVVKSKFGAGRDFTVRDLDDQQVYLVDGKMGTRPKAEITDASGAVVYTVKGHLLGIPKQMTISNAAGEEVAALKAQVFSPIKSKMTLSMAGGHEWSLEGSFLEKDYSIAADGTEVVHISQKWVTVRDSYTVDVAAGADPALALAIVWAVDRWVERD